jgi:hypothetical protein
LPRGYEKDKDYLSQMSYDTSACQDMKMELRESSECAGWQNNGKKGIRLLREEFMCDLK